MPDLTKFSRRTFMLMPLALAACKPGQSVFELSGLSMGTGYNVVAIDSSKSLTETDLRRRHRWRPGRGQRRDVQLGSRLRDLSL